MAKDYRVSPWPNGQTKISRRTECKVLYWSPSHNRSPGQYNIHPPSFFSIYILKGILYNSIYGQAQRNVMSPDQSL